MKNNLPGILVGIAIGLFIAWLLGMFSPASPPATESAAKTADVPAAPAQPAAPTPAAAIKTAAAPAVAAPASPPVKASQPATAALQAAGDQAAFDKVRKQSEIKAMTNNLRMLSTASEQYMLDKGVTAAGYYDLVGTGTDNYIRAINPVMGEDYSGFYLTQHDTQVMIVAPDGTTVTFNL